MLKQVTILALLFLYLVTILLSVQLLRTQAEHTLALHTSSSDQGHHGRKSLNINPRILLRMIGLALLFLYLATILLSVQFLRIQAEQDQEQRMSLNKCLVENGEVTQWPLNETHIRNRGLRPPQVREITPTQKPAINALLQAVYERKPLMQDGDPVQVWEVVDFTEAELSVKLEARRALMVVTMRQARLALLQQGLLASIQPAIDALDEPHRSGANIEWEYSQTVERTRPFVLTLGEALGLTDDDLDALFELAATL
jgi:hypothetical protein